MSNVTLLNGDCLELMRGIDSESIDAIITDPPYGISYQSSWRIDKSARKPVLANDDKPFIWWFWEAYRVIKPDGCLLCFCEWRWADAFKSAIEIAGFSVKSQVIWDRKGHGMGDLNSSFAPQHDIIWFATKGSFSFPGSRPKSIIRSMRISGEDLEHPTEKPTGLIASLIESVTEKDQIVLDPMCGSGSAGVACAQTGRNFIGIEIDPNYYAIAQKRIEAAQAQPALFVEA